ncbi:MAG: flagellar biosynthetic protein FliO [Betaproteobacteria bacterium]|nr:flagellar biosynthetic protein FliO [Betaproteobacteria bacterium]
MKLQFVSLLPALPALGAFALFSGFCQAAADAHAPPILDPLSGFGQMFFGLAVVLAILAAFIWLLKRFFSPIRANGLLRIIGITAVGTREKVVLLEVGEKILMLGVTSSNVSALHVFERGELPLGPECAAPPASSVSAAAFATSFASRLTQALKGRRNAG